MNYSIAVIIPTLNEEKFIAQCLDCVIEQTYPFASMDVMVVDGGSADDTKNIVQLYCGHYPNIRLLNNPGKIQSIAFNIGVNNSAAPYVVRLDAHATYNKDYIERCIQDLSADCMRGNVGGRLIIRPYNDNIWAKSNAILNCSRFGIGGSAFRVGTSPMNVDTVPFGAFPRSVIDGIGGMREDLPRGEDNEYNSRIRKAGYKVYFDPEIISTYVARPTLIASCRQMYSNGKSIGHLFYIDRESIGVRHLIPLTFVVGIIIGVVLSFIWPSFKLALICGLTLYMICDAVASFLVAQKQGFLYFFTLFILFFCVHISYGIGTIIGLFTGRKLSL